MVGFLLGAGSILLIGFLVSLFDREAREALAQAAATLVLTPVIPFYLVLRYVLNRNYRVRTVSADTFRRFANTADVRGLAIHRHGRAHIVLTDPRVRRPRRSEEA